MSKVKEQQKVTKGVKAFRKTSDGSIVTGGIGGSTHTEWEAGKIYELDNDLPLKLCGNGFHFYREKDACFGAALFDDETVFFAIEAYGDVISDTEKCVCKSIKLIESFTPDLDGNRNSGNRNSGNWNSGNRNSGNWNSGYRNSGDRNSGDWNSGNRNSGDWNSGDWNSGNWNSGNRNSGNRNSGNRNSGNRNSGYRNSGDWNSGDRNSGNRNSGDWNSGDWNSGNWNSGNRNSGFFNSDTPKTIRVFNQDCLLEDWENAEKPNFLYFSIEDGETYEGAFRRSWKNATDEDRALLEKLPNFNWGVFTEISGIEKPQEGQP